MVRTPPPLLGGRKVAIVQEYITRHGGAENVLAEMVALLPEADVYCFFNLDPHDDAKRFAGRRIHETRIGALARRLPNYRILFPLFGRLAKGLDLSAYDVVITSSFGLAKSFRQRPGQIHLCYCYTPPRWLWDMSEDHLQEVPGGPLVRGLVRRVFRRLRKQDLEGANQVHHFAAISKFVQERIKRIYGRDSTVIYPPVDTDRFAPASIKADYYFTLSRLVPYKNVDVIVQAFAGMPNRRLVVAGGGPDEPRLRGMAATNTSFLGRISDKEAARRMAEARAFIFAAEEDFGITPVEAQAAGTPVIALARGGALETVLAQRTGVFFDEPRPESIRGAVEGLEAMDGRFSSTELRANAERFVTGEFSAAFTQWVEQGTA